MKRLRQKFWYYVLTKLVPLGSSLIVANRYERQGCFGPIDVRIIFRDTRQPDDYSREELYKMLKIIREAESRQRWIVPEPDSELNR